MSKAFFRNKGVRGFGGGGGTNPGSAGSFLVPPPPGTNLFQSKQMLTSLDLISEGPIEGPCRLDGSRAEGINILESVFYNDNRIKEAGQVSSATGSFHNEKVLMVDKLSEESLGQFLTNLKNIYSEYTGVSGLVLSGSVRISGLDAGNTGALISGHDFIEANSGDIINTFTSEGLIHNPFGFVQFSLNRTGLSLAETCSGTSGTFPSFSGTEDGVLTVKNFYNENSFTRKIQQRDDRVVELPKEFYSNVPIYNNNFVDGVGNVGVRPDGKVDTYRDITNVIGCGTIPFYIGNNIHTGVGGTFLTGKFFVATGDADLEDKIQSGIDNNYDVLVYGDNSVEFATVATSQVEPSRGEIIGAKITPTLFAETLGKFNYGNTEIFFREGSEKQEVIESFSNSTATYLVSQRLLGPFSLVGNAQQGSGNSDVREGGDFADWQLAPPAEDNGYAYTHVVKRNEVDRLIPQISISNLKDTLDENNSDGNGMGTEVAEFVTFRVTQGFEGSDIPFDLAQLSVTSTAFVSGCLDRGISPKTILLNNYSVQEDFRFEGIVSSTYLSDLDLSDDLPKPKLLKNKKISDIQGMTAGLISAFSLNGNEVLYPGDTWKSVNRIAKTEKLEFETESVLINRDVGIASIIEVIDKSFTYPLSSIFANGIDARSFAQLPNRSYDVRLKKVLIPSNYNPLKENGQDKRFIEDQSSYGLRNIQTFNGSTYIKVPDKIDLGTENYEITFKVKFGSFNTSTTPDILKDIDGGSFTVPGRIAIFHRDNDGFGVTPEMRMIGYGPFGTLEVSLIVDISAYSASDVFTVSTKLVGSQCTFTVKVGETLVGTATGAFSSRPSFSYDPDAGTNLLIGSSANHGLIVSNGTQIADFKIKKNNQLLHHWDGTIINTTRLGDCFKDRFGGNHGEIVGTTNAVEDTDFEFGRNKEQIYVGDWDGTFKLGWTDNPAWILYDLMTNSVYGVGSHIDDLEDINIFGLYSIGQHCDAVDEEGFFDGVLDDAGGLEPRFSCNLLLNDDENAFQVLGNVASIFRALAFWNGGGFEFTIDKEKDLMAVFNNSNVLDGIFQYGDLASTARFTRVEVSYVDKKDNFVIKKEYVEDDDRIRQFGLITNEQNGIGCTSKSQARRVGKYVLLSNKLETENVSFQIDNTALLMSPGDIIRIDDELQNFEMNYGKVYEVNTGEGFVTIENFVNTGSIVTGQDDGGFYLFNNAEQQEVKSLFDIVNFNTLHSFGGDADNYSGKLSKEQIDLIDKNQITKFYVTGFESDGNLNKIFFNQNDENYNEITGVRAGSYFNTELDNGVNKYYRVLNLKQEEQNIYRIEAVQHVPEKFQMIEEEDFDLVENAYHIGVPTHEVNTPVAGTLSNTGISPNEIGSFDFSGIINEGVGTPQPIKYRVSLIGPEGSYTSKEFLKDGSATNFLVPNLSNPGVYQAILTSLLNPESVERDMGRFVVPMTNKISENFQFKNIEVLHESDQKFSRDLFCSGELYQTIEDVCFNIILQDLHGKETTYNQLNKLSVDVEIRTEDDFLVSFITDFKGSKFTVSKFDVLDYFGHLNRNYKIIFKLKSDGVLQDQCSYKIRNPEPTIKEFSIDDLVDNKFTFNVSTDRSNMEIDKLNFYRSESISGDFHKFYVAQGLSPQENYKLTIERDYFQSGDGYNTQIMYYKVLGIDDFGSGNFSDVVSGAFKYSSEEEQIEQIRAKTEHNIDTIYIGQGTGNTITTSSNNESGCYLFEKNKYFIDLEFTLDVVGTGLHELSLMDDEGNQIKNIIKSSNKKGSHYFSSKILMEPSISRDYYFCLDSSQLGQATVDEFDIEILKASKKF